MPKCHFDFGDRVQTLSGRRGSVREPNGLSGFHTLVEFDDGVLTFVLTEALRQGQERKC